MSPFHRLTWLRNQTAELEHLAIRSAQALRVIRIGLEAVQNPAGWPSGLNELAHSANGWEARFLATLDGNRWLVIRSAHDDQAAVSYLRYILGTLVTQRADVPDDQIWIHLH